MNTTLTLITVAAMLLHSIFGCGLHHACACESPTVDGVSHAELHQGVMTCHHSNASHHHEHPSVSDDHPPMSDLSHRDHGAMQESAWVQTGVQRDCQHHEDTSHCCSYIHCSFVCNGSVEFRAATQPLIAIDSDCNAERCAMNRSFTATCCIELRQADSLSRCALHCSWQI